MTRGRKPAAPAEIIEPNLDQDRIDNAVAAMRENELGAIARNVEAEQNVRAVALQLGYLLPADCTDPDLIQRDIAANMRRSVEACLEVGRGLAVLKAACEHGQFIARLDVLGIDRKVAAKFMQSASKFSNVSSTRHLLEAAGNQTKLFELLILDDEKLEELELTGQTGELKLDEIATMSVKELRSALREARQKVKDKQDELEATEQISAEKTLKIEKLERRIQTMPPDAARREIAEETAGYVQEAVGAIGGRVRYGFIALAGDGMPDAETRQLLAGYVASIQTVLIELRDEFMLADPVGDGRPEWMRATEGDRDIAGA